MLENSEQNENMGTKIAPLTLREPACLVRCPTCLMSCAILPERIAWWSLEIERLCLESSLQPASPSLRDQLGTALAAHEGLVRQDAETPRGARPPAIRARRSQSLKPDRRQSGLG